MEEHDLKKHGCRPCDVVLKRLTPDEIELYTRNGGNTLQNSLENNSLAVLFNRYKRTREKFIKRKRKSRRAFIEPDDYLSDSSFIDDEAFDGDFEAEDSRSRRKKKRMAYEEDTEWCPDGTGAPLNVKIQGPGKNLRVNPRRKRIESASSCSSDDYFNTYLLGFDNPSPPQPTTWSSQNVHQADETRSGVNVGASTSRGRPKGSKNKKRARMTSPLEGDKLVSKIVSLMEDYSMKNSGKFSKGDNAAKGQKKNQGSVNVGARRKFTPTQGKSRIAHNPKLSIVRVVREVVSHLVSSVCIAVEGNDVFKKVSDDGSVKCKWCDSPFVPNSDTDTFCAICRDIVRKPKKRKSLDQQKTTKNSQKQTPVGRSLIMNKLMKILPKSEQKRLIYSEKVAKQPLKGYNHCKSFYPKGEDVTKENGPVISSVASQGEKVINSKGKKKTIGKNTASFKAKSQTKMAPKPVQSDVAVKTAKILSESYGKTQNKVSVQNVDKGLFLMTFPEPHHELALIPDHSQTEVLKPKLPETIAPELNPTASKNKKFGSYNIPAVPTVVVANYSTNSSENNDYFLSSIYYQNKFTQENISKDSAKNASNSEKDLSVLSLPSMPTLNQLNSNLSENVRKERVNKVEDDGPTSLKTTEEVAVPNLSLNSEFKVQLAPVQETRRLSISDLIENSDLEIFTTRETDTRISSEIESSFFTDFQVEFPLEFEANTMNSEENIEMSVNALISTVENKSVNENTKEADEVLNTNSSSDINATSSKENVKETQNISSNTVPKIDLLKEAMLEIDAISVLGIIDLDKQPRELLKFKIKCKKMEYEKLKVPENPNKERLTKICYDQKLLERVQILMTRYGSFTRMSEVMLLQKDKIQIKKEKMEHESSQSSCQFANSAVTTDQEHTETHLNRLISLNDFFLDDQFSIPSTPHQQISTNIFPAHTGNDMINDSRETPSRGSGPITPSRPESAMSQNEDVPLTPAQIKKEKLESFSTTPPCSFSVNAPQPQLTTVSSNNLLPYSLNSSTVTTNTISNGSDATARLTSLVNSFAQNPPNQLMPYFPTNASAPLQLFNYPTPSQTVTNRPSDQSLLQNNLMQQLQQRCNLPPYSQISNKAVLLNIQGTQSVIRQPPPNVSISNSTSSNMNLYSRTPQQQVCSVRQVYIPRSQVINQSGYNQTFYNQALNAQNRPPIRQQQQVLTQQTPMTISNFINRSIEVPPIQNVQMAFQQQPVQYQRQRDQLAPSGYNTQTNQPPNMRCAVCNRVATLRCKQCSKVAYCNTECAKIFWQTKHKMECRQTPG